MTLFFYILIGVITFGAFLHAWVRKEYDLSRTVVINRPRAEVYAFIRQLKYQPRWFPWFHRDPQVQLKFKGEDGKLGAALYWRGNKLVGEGIERITKIKEGKIVETQLLFLRPYKTVAHIYIGVKEMEGERTKMVMGVRGVHRFPESLLSFFYRLEKRIVIDLERGLQGLKKEMEKK